MSQAYLVCCFLCAFISLFLLISSLFQPPSKEQKILTVLSICLLLLNLGVSMLVTHPSHEAAKIALNISHYGGVHIGFCLLFYLCALSRIRIPLPASFFMIGINVVFVTLLGTDTWLNLMYTRLEFGKANGLTTLLIDYGTGYWLYIGWILLYFIIMLVIVIRSSLQKKYLTGYMKSNVTVVMLASAVSFASFFVPFLLKSKYDFRFLGCTISVLAMYIVLYRSNIFHLRQATQEDLLNESDDIILTCDKTGRLIYANKKACEIMEIDPDISYGIPLTDIGEKTGELSEVVPGTEKIYSGKTYICEKRVVKDKKYAERHIVRLRDVTAEREHLNEVMALKQDADSANRAKNMFLTHMSHEIRTPINSIIGMNEMIIRESNEAHIRDYANDLMKSGRTLITLVNDLIEYSKLESGTDVLNPSYYMVEDLFKEIFTIMKFKSEGKNLKILIDIDPSLPRSLYGDEIRIRQMLTQLVDNAVKYTDKGSITITVGYDRLDDVKLNLIVSIRDTGIGIKETDFSKLFGDFDSEDIDSTHRSDGVGLGLTIVRRLINLMSGTISIDSKPGSGSCFKLTFPQIISDPANIGEIVFKEEPKKVKRVGFKAPTATVLVVDDIKTNRTIAKLLVKNTGIQFEESESGEKALEMVKAKHYDLILLDQRMPGLTGVETLKKMNEIDHLNKDVPIVALTADAGPGAEEYYSVAGFTEYMAKPLDPAKYETMLIRLIPAEKIEVLETSDNA